MRKLRRPSHATIVAYLALFVAVGGTTAYAANTVFSSDIVDGQVKTADLANAGVTQAKLGNSAVINGKLADAAVTNGKLANSSVNSGKVANGTLQAVDLAPGILGPAGYEFASSGLIDIPVLSANAFTLQTIQLCPVGKVAVGGGFSTLNTNANDAKFMLVQTSQRDSSDPRAWQVAVRNTDGVNAHSLSVSVTALCVNAP